MGEPFRILIGLGGFVTTYGLWRWGGLVVSALDFDLEVGGGTFSLSSCCSLRQGTLFNIASLHQGVQLGTGYHNAGGNLAME